MYYSILLLFSLVSLRRLIIISFNATGRVWRTPENCFISEVSECRSNSRELSPVTSSHFSLRSVLLKGTSEGTSTELRLNLKSFKSVSNFGRQRTVIVTRPGRAKRTPGRVNTDDRLRLICAGDQESRASTVCSKQAYGTPRVPDSGQRRWLTWLTSRQAHGQIDRQADGQTDKKRIIEQASPVVIEVQRLVGHIRSRIRPTAPTPCT